LIYVNRRAPIFAALEASQFETVIDGLEGRYSIELHPAGSWTAVNVATLEMLSSSVAAQLDRSKAVRLDMAGVRALDTIGAWLLEKMSRRGTSAGHRVDMVGVADAYTGLMEEVRHVNRHNPAPAPAPNPVLIKVSDVGRSAVGATEDLTAFLQMLGALFVTVYRILSRPKSLRVTSVFYQLD
jgi:phospholipid/cholesterol/gamma-HCH transport system permease protein